MSETRNELNSELTAVRSALIGDAIKSWTNQLVDQGGRNTLLHFRDLKRGTLDLSSPPTSSIAIDKLLKGQKIRLPELFDDPEDLADAVRRARTLHANSKENEEERGLQTLHLASFMANWVSEQSNSTPNSPVLLQPLSIVPLGSR